jgi:hypothetical protein
VLAQSGDDAQVRAYFAHHTPQSAAGAIALQKTLLAARDRRGAEKVARDAWEHLYYDADNQKSQLALMGGYLVNHHVQRLTNLLWDGRLDESRRMLPLVSTAQRRLAERMTVSSGATATTSTPRPGICCCAARPRPRGWGGPRIGPGSARRWPAMRCARAMRTRLTGWRPSIT